MLNKLNQLILDYEQIKAESYIYDYIDEIINIIDIHREELLKEIHQISNEIIEKLNEKEEKCKINASKINKMNLEQLISTAELQSFKQILRKPDEAGLKNLIANINERMKEVHIETKKYKSNLLMNEGICFINHEKSSSFGELYFYSEEYKMFSNNCGQLIQSFNECHISCVDENSKKLITSSEYGIITIWNLESGKRLKTLKVHEYDVTSVLFIPNNKLISASWSWDIKIIKIWDLNTYKCLNTLKNESDIVCFCLISDNQIACGCMNGSIKICDLNSLTEINSFEAHNYPIRHLLLVNKTKLISSSHFYQNDDTIKIWNLQTFECIKVLDHSYKVSFLELTSDDNLLSFSFEDQTVKIWQIETGELLDLIDFEDIDTVNCVKILNEHLIAVGLYEGQIKIYNFKNKEKIITIPVHQSPVVELLLLKNDCLLSQSEAGQIKIWKILDDN